MISEFCSEFPRCDDLPLREQQPALKFLHMVVVSQPIVQPMKLSVSITKKRTFYIHVAYFYRNTVGGMVSTCCNIFQATSLSKAQDPSRVLAARALCPVETAQLVRGGGGFAKAFPAGALEAANIGDGYPKHVLLCEIYTVQPFCFQKKFFRGS